jgi:urate oxidase
MAITATYTNRGIALDNVYININIDKADRDGTLRIYAFLYASLEERQNDNVYETFEVIGSFNTSEQEAIYKIGYALLKADPRISNAQDA